MSRERRGGRERGGSRSLARVARAHAIALVIFARASAGTCAYASRRETCATTRGFEADGGSEACGGATLGVVACERRRNGARFDGVKSRLDAANVARGAMDAVRASGEFTIEIAATPEAETSGRQPLATFAITSARSNEEPFCGSAGGGYYLSIWLQRRRVYAQFRKPGIASFTCSEIDVFSWTGVAVLDSGSVHRIAVTYDANGARLFVNGTQSFPPPMRLDYALSPGGDAMTTWNRDAARLIVGAYAGDYFTGVIYAINVHDRALNASELLERANAPLENSRPFPLSQNVTMDEDATASIMLDAYDADGDETTLDIVRLPSRGAIFADSALLSAINVVPYRLSARERKVWFQPARDEYSALGVDYDAFEFAARDAGGSIATDRGVVRIRVTSVNDVPIAGNETRSVSILGYAPERVRLIATDVDQACPPNVANCARDRFTSIVISREPTLGALYASCDDKSALLAAQVVRNRTNITFSTGSNEDITCFTYVYGGAIGAVGAVDSVEYVITDSYGATSATLDMKFSIQSPCVMLDREHSTKEDEIGEITLTAACVGSSGEGGLAARASLLPKYGTLSSRSVGLNVSFCSDHQRSVCETWATADGKKYDAVECACGVVNYVPNRDYFNTPSVDVYGQPIKIGDESAPEWKLGEPDDMRFTLATSDGWTTIPYAVYIWVRRTIDAPTVLIDRRKLKQMTPIVPETTSYVLSEAVDILMHPDYDIDAMSLTIWSLTARSIELVGDALVGDDAEVHILPDVDSRSNSVRLIGAPSAIRHTLRQGKLAYTPRDANTRAFFDVLHLRVIVGERPFRSPPCTSAWQTPPCRFDTTTDAPQCASNASSPSSSCAFETEFELPIADSPSYVAELARRSNPHGRTAAERAAVVFAIVFSAAFVATAIAIKLTSIVLRCVRAGFFSF